MANLTLQALEVKQNGTRLLLTKMRAGDLPKFTEIETYDPKKNFDDPAQGYQRQPEIARVKKFANWLKNEKEAGAVRMPTAILLSSRGTDIALSPMGTITVKGHNKLPLVDGQHRMRGFDYAISEKALTEFADYEVPVVIMMQIDKIGEMRQFNTVNGTVKSVRTDLVNMILTQLADQEGNEAVREAEHWKVVVSKAVMLLNNENDGPWKDQIVMPNSAAYSKDEVAENPELGDRRVVRATSFMTSLKPIEAYLADHHATPNQSLNDRAALLAKIISEFWKAIQEKMPECFQRPNDYVLQKSTGIFALHMLCKHLLRDMHTGRRPWAKEHFGEMLADSAELSDASFWAVGSDEGTRGEGAKYAGMKNFAELADLIRQGLQS